MKKIKACMHEDTCIHVLTLSAFLLMRYDDSVEPEQVYKITNSHGDFRYGWSPDGIGVYWYPNLNELVAEHGVTL